MQTMSQNKNEQGEQEKKDQVAGQWMYDDCRLCGALAGERCDCDY